MHLGYNIPMRYVLSLVSIFAFYIYVNRNYPICPRGWDNDTDVYLHLVYMHIIHYVGIVMSCRSLICQISSGPTDQFFVSILISFCLSTVVLQENYFETLGGHSDQFG